MMMMENGFSSPRRNHNHYQHDSLPVGLRVLVVDDDLAWLKILEKMLKKCSYEVTTCTLAQEALQLLRDRKGGFDIVISDVNMPDMDGFKLLEHVGLEMDLPVIMMSVDGETSRVMKGVQHGACDYLLKPIRMKELKNIWQHVVRKRMHEGRDIDCFDDRNGPDSSSYSGYYGGDQSVLRKRKDIENNKHDEKEPSECSSSSMKKARVVWTVELHQKFVQAVNQIGIDSDKIGPKKILDLMDVKWLTRENVASHLQKYRLYLSRIRKEDETEVKVEGSCVTTKTTDHLPKDSGNGGGGTCHAVSSTCRTQTGTNTDQVYPENHAGVSTMGTLMPFETDLKKADLLTDESKPFSNNDKTCPSEMGLDCPFKNVGPSIDYPPFDSAITDCYPWTTDISNMQYETEYKPRFNLDGCFSQPESTIGNTGLMDQKFIDVGPTEGGLESLLGGSNPKPYTCAFEPPPDLKDQKPVNPIQPFQLMNQQGVGPGTDMGSDLINSFNNDCFISMDNQSQMDFRLLGEDFAWWIQGGFDYIGISDFNIPNYVSDIPFLKFGVDHDLFDCKECPTFNF